ncbi:hypothetical protein FMM05_00105 [Flavobacterium zepuense]|uniref:Uncharacterized protein n=1 Tax=Flavobacterium zepuense TaxID=2593302 RepID=A0A552V9E9_9FLAO|nr:hypothetical protein [Flavobacterium zepuense]TRW27088.1 hypothetical protein FMM05_00105 [Flavobacterium zepuense]
MEHTYNGIYSEAAFEKFEVDDSDFDAATEDIRQRLNVRLKHARYSTVLVEQLARHKLNIYEKFGNELHAYHFQTILDIIEQVENGAVMNVRDFRNEPLAGLKHIHHNSNTFIAQNMLNTWREKYGKKDEVTFQNSLLTNIFYKLLDEYSPAVAQQKALTFLLNRILYESKFRPLKKQTGEWIIYTQHDGTNYYLCLATHQEAKDFGDEVVAQRLQPCFKEFPELSRSL